MVSVPRGQTALGDRTWIGRSGPKDRGREGGMGPRPLTQGRPAIRNEDEHYSHKAAPDENQTLLES